MKLVSKVVRAIKRQQSQTVSTSRPPTVAPKKLPERKPRSRTTGDVFSVLPEPPSETRGPVLSSSCELERIQPSKTPPQTSAKPVSGRKAPPPPKPKPMLPPEGSPLGSRRMTEKPAVPHKPFTRKASLSPPNVRRSSDGKTPSPPPPVPLALERKSPDSSEGYEELNFDSQSLESASWFVGKMERLQAEQFLKEHGRQREFLVRERTAKDGYYALSIRYHYSFKHFNIDPTADGQYAMGQKTFSRIDEAIQHFQHNSLFIYDGQHVTLGQPVRRRTKHST